MTRIESMFTQNPNKNIIEDRVQTTELELNSPKIKMIMTRIKIILYLLNWITKIDGYIH